MTYRVGLFLRRGLAMLGGTRTDAGVDDVATYSKMFTAEVPGERALCLLSSGNLAITQGAWNRLRGGVFLDGARETLLTAPTMFRAARPVGAAVRAVYAADGPSLAAQGVAFAASPPLGGQVAGGPHRLY